MYVHEQELLRIYDHFSFIKASHCNMCVFKCVLKLPARKDASSQTRCICLTFLQCACFREASDCKMSEAKSKPSKGSMKKKEGDADGKVLSDTFKYASMQICKSGI